MSQYYARWKPTNSHHYIEVKQLLHIVIVNSDFGGKTWYYNLDEFLSEWDELEREVRDKDAVGGLVGV